MVLFVKHTSQGQVEVVDGKCPQPANGEILVKIAFVGQNPVDHEINSYSPVVGATIGYDFSGVVEKTGSGVTRFKKGDRVCGFSFGSCSSNHEWGAFGEYAIGFEFATLKVPDSMALEKAVTLPVGVGVAGLTVKTLGLEKGEPIFINGGASGMGLVMIQFAKSLGASPIITTASPHNFNLVKSLGADQVFDYHDSSYTKAITAVTSYITKALDASTLKDPSPLFEAIISSAGGKVVVLNPPEFISPPTRKDIEYEMVNLFGVFEVEYEIFGQKLRGAEGEKRFMTEWIAETAQALLDKGGLVPLNVKKIDGGLGAVQGGLTLNAEGKVSGEKVVYQIAADIV